MNQEQGNLVEAYLGLQGFEVVAVVRTRLPGRGQVKVVRVERRTGQHECSGCGRRHERALFMEPRPIWLRDCSIGDVETYVEVQPMRVACCAGTRVERLPFAMAGFRMTRRFFERVAALCTRLPVATVAKMARLSWDTVARVDAQAIAMALGDRTEALSDLRWISVDEVSRTGGREYFTIVTNLADGRVVWIGDGKGRRGLLAFLRRIGVQGRRQLRGVVSDLGYLRVIAARLPRAVHVLDRFHIVQWVNRALDDVRRRLFSASPRDSLGRALKIKKWLLLSARENLDLRDKLVLDRLIELNQPLYRGYLLKEQLRAILRYPWKYFGVLRERLHEWILAVFDAALPEFKKVAARLADHLDAVIAGHQHDVPLGLAESRNSQIAALRFQARGYRDPEYFKLKILQRCGLPHNPWARIVL